MDLEGSIRPAMYLAKELAAKGHKVSIMSPVMSDAVEGYLRASGIKPINLRAKLTPQSSGLSMLWFETWVREAFLRLNSRHGLDQPSVALNFSQVIALPCLAWYLQGPPSAALRDMERELSPGFRIAYNALKSLIEYADKKLVIRMEKASSIVIANSKFCASMYSSFGVKVHDVIYPPIDCQKLRPSTSNPSSNYVLTYFGKETKFSAIKRVADMGVKLKAFGSKTPFIPEDLLRHPNVEFIGRVSTKELVDLYSNALFTLFPFTHEPFGYVPLESMACGTPTVTYDIQGPSEYVISGNTGWLAHTDEELEEKSAEIWKEGYPPRMRTDCLKSALRFDRKVYLEKWSKLLSGSLKNENAESFSLSQTLVEDLCTMH